MCLHRMFSRYWNYLFIGFLLLPGAQPAVRAAAQHDVSIQIPVVLKNLKPGLAFTSMPSPPLHIELKVRGDKTLLESLPSMKLSYVLDLENMAPGFHTAPVQVNCVSVPSGVSILSISPETIHFRLEQEIEKSVPVEIVWQGTPAPGYTIAGTRAKPDRILLRGPKTIIDGIHTVSTHPIDIGNVPESFKKEITLDLVSNTRMVPKASPITAEITIAAVMVTKTLKDIPVQGRNTSRLFQISPPAISIQVKGPAKALSSLESQHTDLASIDLADLQPGVFVRRATIELPVDVVLIQADPKIFTVTIK